MSTEVKKDDGAPPPAANDELKNLKAEMNRKFENVTATLTQKNEELKALLAASAQKAAPDNSAREGVPLSDLFYKDPEAYTARIIDEADKRATARINAANQDNVQRSTAIQKLYKDYPELGSEDHELTKLAIAKYADISKEHGSTPAAYRLAALEAAQELGVKPKSKRPAAEDDFSVSGNGSDGNRSDRRRKRDELAPETIQLAELMGVDIERVKKRQTGRKNFGKWE